jgi:hypothetical protein
MDAPPTEAGDMVGQQDAADFSPRLMSHLTAGG